MITTQPKLQFNTVLTHIDDLRRTARYEIRDITPINKPRLLSVIIHSYDGRKPDKRESERLIKEIKQRWN